jgi:glycosyltransferase involved in cell wall biosynthesis
MTENPLVSVVIASHNASAFVSDAVDSVLAQTYQPVEVIVVDDGSQDNTREVLMPYFKRIHYIWQENQGAAAARNVGIAASQGSYVAILDADDLWLPEKLTEQIAFLNRNPDVGFVASHAIAVDAQRRFLSQEPTYPDWHAEIVPIERILLNSPLTNSTILIRRECVPSPVAYGPWYSEDWHFCLQVALNHRVGFVDKILIHYRVLPTSKSAMVAAQDRVNAKYKDRLEIVSSIVPLLEGRLPDLESLIRRVEARESVSAAIPSYGNSAFDIAESLLARAIQLDPTHWYSGGELAGQISHYAKLSFQSGGAKACLGFLDGLFSHLPNSLPNPEQLKRTVYGHVHIFVIGFDRYRRGDFPDARVNIAKGLRYDQSHLRNRGVLLTLAKCYRDKKPNYSTDCI